MRAISRFAERSRALFSSAPVADWKRRLNSSWRVSTIFSASSSSVRSRSSLALKEISLPSHELHLDRQLLPGKPQRLVGKRLVDAGELEHDASGLDDGDPAFGRSLAGAHPRLGGLLGERLVREEVDPDLAAAADLARHRDTGRLDLTVRDPAVLERLDPVVAELHRGLALRDAVATAAMVLSVLGSLGAASGVSLLRRRHVGRRSIGLLGAFGSVSGAAALPVARAAASALTGLRAPSTRARRPRATPTAGTTPAGGSAAASTPSLLDEAEAFAILAAATAALARRAEALCSSAALSAGLILVAEARFLAGGGALVALGHDLALVDPDLDADPAERRLRLGEAVVDVGADRVQRHTTLGVALRPAHLAAAEAAAALDLDSLCARAHRRGERALHRAPEGDAVLQLLRDRLRDELSVELGPLDLVDVDVDGLAGDRVQLLAERVDLDARLADHDARAGGVDVDRDPLLVLADQDVGQPGVRQLAVDVLADADVLEDVVGELLLAGVPVRLPVVDDTDAQAAGMDFLAH